jgi:hypothetical protein
MTSRGTRVLAIANAALWIAIALGIAKSAVPLDALGWDLSVFRDASKLLMRGAPLYDFAAQASEHTASFGRSFAVHYPYAYPPIFAMETAPLALVSQIAAFAIVTLASLAALAWAARRTTGRATDALWVTASYPAVYGILAGQLAIVALAIFVATYALLSRDRPIAAGLVCSLVAFKPQLLVVMPIFFLVVPRARRALVGLALGGAAQIALCFAIAPDATLAFPSALARMSAYVETHFRASLGFTWRSFFVVWMPHHRALADTLALVAILACGAAGTIAMMRSRGDLPRAMAIAMLTTFACAWHCAPYDWVVLALPAWLLVPRLKLSPLAMRGALVLFALPWTFVAIADAVPFHPALPYLCATSAWLVLRSQLDASRAAS